MTSIACLIATWRDGELLTEAVASAAPHVDAVIVLDGGYAGVVAAPASRPEELIAAGEAGAHLFGSGAEPGGIGMPNYWLDEIAKRNVLLELARAFLPAGDRWALVLDADEVLIRGELLPAAALAVSGQQASGLYRREPNGAVWWAPSRLFEIDDYTRYSGRSYFVNGLGPDGFRSLQHEGPVDVDLEERYLGPFVEHRWDRRPSWRREVQRRYGRILAERDHGTGC